MGRALLVLHNDAMRAKAIDWIRRAPRETRVEFKGPKRTLPQNDRMWAMLTDIATQKKWHGLTLDADAWKLIFLDALHREMRIVPNLDGTGFVNLNQRSSDLSVSEMTDMIELMFAWGAQNAVKFQEPEMA
jgi:hypothetical protein